jgi:hypothetical protein
MLFTPQDFVSKWKRVTAHSWKTDMEDEEILERLLSLNLDRGK